jgi:hypothetical protein
MNVPSERDIARAQALGRLAGWAQRPVESNPYSRDERVLRARWVLAYARAGGRVGLEPTDV